MHLPFLLLIVILVSCQPKNDTNQEGLTIKVKDNLFSGGADIRSKSKTFEDHFVGSADPAKMNFQNPIVFNQITYEIAADDNPILFLFDFK
jgi:hypothetical protein